MAQGSEFPMLQNRLIEREELVFGNVDGIDLDLDDIIFLARDVWRAKSAFADSADTALEKGLMRHVSNLHFTRFTPNSHCSLAIEDKYTSRCVIFLKHHIQLCACMSSVQE